jgi:hypothetical protein
MSRARRLHNRSAALPVERHFAHRLTRAYMHLRRRRYTFVKDREFNETRE